MAVSAYVVEFLAFYFRASYLSDKAYLLKIETYLSSILIPRVYSVVLCSSLDP